MKLACESCYTPFEPADINAALGLATCRRCNAVYDLRKRLEDRKPEVAVRAKVPLPTRFRVAEEPGVLRIWWRWFKPQTIFLMFFCAAWDAFLLFWYSIALFVKGTPWIMVVFPLAHVAVGVGLTYTVISQLFNKTQVEVGLDRLVVRHGPIPWRGNVTLSAEEVLQIFCDEQQTRTKSGSSVSYQVNAVVRGNTTVRLLSGLEDKQQALYLEQAIERRLRIPDEAVAGELSRASA